MVDLGKYASDVLIAYAFTLVILAALVGITMLSVRRSKAALKDAENRMAAQEGKSE